MDFKKNIRILKKLHPNTSAGKCFPVALLLGGLLFFFFFPARLRAGTNIPWSRSIDLLSLLLAALFSIFIPIGAYCGWIGRQMRVKSRQAFQAAKTEIEREFFIRAAARGRYIMLLAALFSFCGFAGMVLALVFRHLVLSAF